MKTNRTLVVLSALTIVFGGCGETKDPTAMVLDEVRLFHNLYNSQEYDQVYFDASYDFQRLVDQDSFLSFIGDVRKNLGSHIRVGTVSSDVLFEITGTTVSLSIQSLFESGSIVENFIYKGDRDRFRLVYYGLQPSGSTFPAVQAPEIGKHDI